MSNPQAVIPDSFAALANLTRALEEFKKTQATPQGPAGPTVAMQAAQAAEQASQPSAPQAPEGQPAPPPGQPQPQQNGIAGIAQNAGIGAQIQAQQQQAAQQAMMAQAQQAQPQQMASGGIAGLNAHNMHGFKEGGVLGYAGPDGSGPVPEAEGFAEGEYDQTRPNRSPMQLLRSVLGIPESTADIKAKIEEQRASDIAKLEADRAKNMSSVQSSDRPDRDAAMVAILQAQAQKEQQDTRKIQQPVGGGGKQTPRPPALTGPESVEGMIQRTQKYAQDVDTTEQRNEVNRLNKMRADQPLAGIEQLAAYRRAQEEYDTAAKERKESFGSRQFRELMRDMSMNRNGEGMARVGEEERRLTEADTTRRLTNAQLSGLIVDAQNAKKVGDQEKYIAAIKDVNTILKDNADRKAQLAGQAGTIGANLYNTDTMANLDRIKIGTMNEANKLAKEAHSLNEFNSSLARFNANKQAIDAELDKSFNKKTEDLIKMAQVDPEKKKEYIALEAQHEAYKTKQVQSINDQIYRTELAMHKQHGQGMPAPVNQNAISANAPAVIPFNKLPTK
jgi:hypothetical protein